jgi:hypothetical protein
MAASDGRPIPKKNAAYRVTFPIFDNDGDLVVSAGGLDSERSIDGGTFADCTNEATQIATNSGMYYLDLNASEMNGDTIAIIVKTTTTDAKTTPIVVYPVAGGIKEIYSDTTIIYSDTTAIFTDTNQIASDTIKIYSDTTIIYSDTTVIHSETTAIQTDTGNIYSDTTIIYSDTTAIHSDTTAIHSDTTAIHSDTTAIETDTGNIYSDTTIIYSDTTAIHSDTTAIETDTGNIYSDTTIIASDVVLIYSDTTYIEANLATADNVWDEVMDVNAPAAANSAREYMNIMVAVLAGVTADEGSWSAQDLGGTKTRVEATLDTDGNRTSIDTLTGA